MLCVLSSRPSTLVPTDLGLDRFLYRRFFVRKRYSNAVTYRAGHVARPFWAWSPNDATLASSLPPQGANLPIRAHALSQLLD